MSKINNGGPAFPAGHIRKSRPAHDPGADFRVTDVVEPKQAGMSLRDWFAGQAMAAIISKTPAQTIEADRDAQAAFDEWSMMVARGAYEYADAMIAKRDGRSFK